MFENVNEFIRQLGPDPNESWQGIARRSGKLGCKRRLRVGGTSRSMGAGDTRGKYWGFSNFQLALRSHIDLLDALKY